MPTMSDNVNPLLKGKMVFVCAVNQEGFIGKDGKGVWVDSHDRRRFRRLTTGHTVVYGRKTWEALGCKPLPDRVNIVLSKTLPHNTPGIFVVRQPSEVKLAYEAHGKNLLYVIGGSKVFAELIKEADVILMTQSQDTTIGDTPLGFTLDGADWAVTMTSPISKIQGQARVELDVMEELFEEIPHYQFAAEVDCNIKMATTYSDWFFKRFMPIFLTHYKSKLAGEDQRAMVTKMYDHWRKAQVIPAPRVTPLLEGHDVATNYMVQLMFGTITPFDAFRMRMYGLVDVPDKVYKAVLKAEEKLEAMLANPGERVLSHTYLTLQRRPKQEV